MISLHTLMLLVRLMINLHTLMFLVWLMINLHTLMFLVRLMINLHTLMFLVRLMINLHTLKLLNSVRYGDPCTGLDRILGFEKVEAPRFHENWHIKKASLSILGTGHLYPQKVVLVCRSVKKLSRPQGHSAGREITMTLSRIEPATYRLTAQCLN
jgi:hypothetical protein